MAKNLTRRQKEFLGQFLDMYKEIDEPIHYVELAKRLDLGKITVYEMLRLLEKRGLVQSEYQLSSGKRGPGRSTVLFQPTQEAVNLINRLSEGVAEIESWEITREHILAQLYESGVDEYETLLDELLIRIPEHRSPLIYITDMITATILSVATIRETAEENGLLDRLRRIGLPGEIGISALAGIGSALTMVEDVNLRFSTFLFEQSGKYHEMLSQINTEKRGQLSDFARQIVKNIKG
jgi:predicted transcriptional regulator